MPCSDIYNCNYQKKILAACCCSGQSCLRLLLDIGLSPGQPPHDPTISFTDPSSQIVLLVLLAHLQERLHSHRNYNHHLLLSGKLVVLDR